MKMSLHIYSTNLQPATKFVDDEIGEFTFKPRKRLWTDCCKRRRIAANCNVAVYYGKIDVYCKPGKGCKAER